MKKTLSQIIEEQKSTRPSGQAAAAYWAGQEQMRGQIVRAITAAAKDYKPGRYHHREASAINEILNCSRLLGGSGRDDSAEILNWEFKTD